VFERLNVALAEDVGSRGTKSKLEPSTIVRYIYNLASVSILPEFNMQKGMEMDAHESLPKKKFQIKLNR
jgi:hypothetical protein